MPDFDFSPILPLGVCVADTEGGMGYMIAQSLQNRLLREGQKIRGDIRGRGGLQHLLFELLYQGRNAQAGR